MSTPAEPQYLPEITQAPFRIDHNDGFGWRVYCYMPANTTPAQAVRKLYHLDGRTGSPQYRLIRITTEEMTP